MKRAVDSNMDLFEALMDAIESPDTHPNTSGQLDWLEVGISDSDVLHGDDGVPVSVSGVMTPTSKCERNGVHGVLHGDYGVPVSVSGVMTPVSKCERDGVHGVLHGDDGVMLASHLPIQATTNTIAKSTKSTKPKKTVVKKYGKQAFNQPYLFEMSEGDDPDSCDPIKKVNEAYRIRRDINNESLDMALILLGLDIRAGIEKDDRKWNAIFSQAREEITKEISYLRLVLGDKMKVEVDWQRPLGFPYVALRAPDGRRIVETDSIEMRAYGVRSASMLWNHILEKQKLMHKMAKDYSGMESIALHLPKAVKKAMGGTRSQKFTMTREIANQINTLPWVTYLREETGGAFSPLPYNLYESLRLRHWAVAEAVKNHVIYMNMLYNLVQKETSHKHGTPRRAGLAVRITTGKADIPVTSWALWINHRNKNLFYTTVKPVIRSKKHGKYVSKYSFKISDAKGQLIGESIHRAHLSHMADIYRTVDSVLAELQILSNKTGKQMQKLMGYRHTKDSPAAAGKASWRPSGHKLKWLPAQ